MGDKETLLALIGEVVVASENKKFVRNIIGRGDMRGAQLYLLGAIDSAFEWRRISLARASFYARQLGLKGPEATKVDYTYPVADIFTLE